MHIYVYLYIISKSIESGSMCRPYAENLYYPNARQGINSNRLFWFSCSNGQHGTDFLNNLLKRKYYKQHAAKPWYICLPPLRCLHANPASAKYGTETDNKTSHHCKINILSGKSCTKSSKHPVQWHCKCKKYSLHTRHRRRVIAVCHYRIVVDTQNKTELWKRDFDFLAEELMTLNIFSDRILCQLKNSHCKQSEKT